MAENFLEKTREGLMQGQVRQVKESIQKAAAQGISPQKILQEGLIDAMAVIGGKFQKKELYVPEVLLSARAMLAGLEVLEPMLAKTNIEPKGKIVLGTVQGDIHSIGKNLVGIMMKGAGFKVEDIGVDIPPQKFVEAAKQGAQIIGMSCIISTSLPFMKTTIEALDAAGLRGKVKVLVGGAVVSPGYAQKIGADGYAPEAASAADKAKELLGLT